MFFCWKRPPKLNLFYFFQATKANNGGRGKYEYLFLFAELIVMTVSSIMFHFRSLFIKTIDDEKIDNIDIKYDKKLKNLNNKNKTLPEWSIICMKSSVDSKYSSYHNHTSLDAFHESMVVVSYKERVL